MDDPLSMRSVERISDLISDPQSIIQRDRTAPQSLGQRFPVDELQHERWYPRCVLESEDGADVGMIERSEHTRFALEAREALGIGRELRRENFEGNVTAEPRITSPIHFAHTAASEER